MKTAFAVALAASLTAGCSLFQRQRPASPPAPQPVTAPTVQPAPGTPTVTPVAKRSGKVASVNAELRFAVVDFSVGGVPPDGKTMGVYRGGQKVAEVKISSPVVVGSNTAADILSGNVQVGDVVQDD